MFKHLSGNTTWTTSVVTKKGIHGKRLCLQKIQKHAVADILWMKCTAFKNLFREQPVDKMKNVSTGVGMSTNA